MVVVAPVRVQMDALGQLVAQQPFFVGHLVGWSGLVQWAPLQHVPFDLHKCVLKMPSHS